MGRIAWFTGIALTVVGIVIAWLAWQHPKSPPQPSPPTTFAGNNVGHTPLPDTPNPPPSPPNTPSPRPSEFTAVVEEPPGMVAYVYDAPSTDANVVATLGNGTRIQILCTVEGDPVISDVAGIQSVVWDKISSGYIPDANVNTGTTQPVMPNCSG